MYCVQQSRIDGVRFWLNVNAGVNSRFANRIWNGEVVRLLTSAFLMAIDNRDTETAQLLLENGADLHGLQSSGLRNAVRYGDIKTVEMLLEKGANVAVERHEPLMTATFYGYTHMVQLLIKYKADVNAPHAMRWAVLGGHAEIVRLLIANGSSEGSVALRIAKKKGQRQIIEMLSAHGVK